MFRLSVEVGAKFAMRKELASDHYGSSECLNASQMSCPAFKPRRLLECQNVAPSSGQSLPNAGAF